MFQLRKGVFETNSSSTHSICITKDDIFNMPIPSVVGFKPGEFGWEWRTLRSTHQKASYLYTAALLFDEEHSTDYVGKIKYLLNKNNIVCTFFTCDSSYPRENGHIDHHTTLLDFVKDVCNDEKKLLRYLFSAKSFILTGNDNDENNVDIMVNYNHDVYYKGN